MAELAKPVSAAKLIDHTVFDSFKTLTSSVDADRFKGSLSLLQHLNRSKDEQQLKREQEYTLTRLVRGLGSSTFASRAGFFSTLVGFLTLPENANINQQQIIEVLRKQLNTGKVIADKEDSDALIGHILLCGALLRSRRLLDEPTENVAECVEILVQASKNKVFHTSLAYKFLVDLLEQLSPKQFRAAVWPTMAVELKRSWERQTCNTLHFLLEAAAKYPDLVNAGFLQGSIKTPEILSPLAYKHLGRIFWGTTSMSAIAHPSYDTLSRFLISVKRSQLVTFWTTEVNETLAAPTKIKEVVTLKLLTDLLNESELPLDAKTATKLLTPRFIKMIVSSLKSLKLQKHDVLVTFYAEFCDALNQFFERVADDESKLLLLKRFLLHPGNLLLEKYLPQNTIRQLITKLGQDGVVALFAMYKSIFLGQLAKDPKDKDAEWLNVERLHACQMMQYLLAQKCVQSADEWRIEQLKFLMTVGLFYVNDATEVVSKEKATAAIAKPLSQNAKSVFFASLEMKLSLADEKNVLLSLVEHANEIVSRSKATKYIQGTWTLEAQAAWVNMHDKVQASKKEKKLTMVFQILFLHMGLQLFREPDMAQVAIADLVKCQEKTKQVKKAQKKARKSAEGELEEEPEWIEVVVDLFLHLLSQNASFLRHLVAHVFPHLCPELTLTAVHQILAMLDMKDGKNPLTSVGEPDDEEEDELESDNEEDMKSDEEEDAQNDDEADDDDEEEDDDDEDIQEDEGTVTDQLRNAVSAALNSTLPDKDDVDSVDLNDMGDDEAERLDTALSTAFQLMRKAGAAHSKKKSKKDRTTTTTVMHFRIRVIDLIEIYLKTNPTLAITIEIMLALFSMIEHCRDGDLKPLSDKIDRVLRHLLALRQFDNVSDVTAANLCDLLQSLVDKMDSPTKLGAHNQLLSKSFVFLISNSSLLPDAETNDAILKLIQSYATEFITSGNPRIPNTLLQDIFKIRWTGVWVVAETVAEQGLRDGPASLAFRRTQALEQLLLMYKNHGFIKSNVSTFNKSNAKIEKSIQHFLDASAQPNARKMSPKGFAALCALLFEMNRTHQLVGNKSHLKWAAVGKQVQLIRKRLALNSVQQSSYAKFCKNSGLVVIKKIEAAAVEQRNGKRDADDSEELPASKVNGVDKKAATLKRKAADGDVKNAKKEKKAKRDERLRIASSGLNGMSFAANALDSDDEQAMDEESEDEADEDQETDASDEAAAESSDDDKEAEDDESEDDSDDE